MRFPDRPRETNERDRTNSERAVTEWESTQIENIANTPEGRPQLPGKACFSFPGI
jgi:hypothetical protein